MTACFFLPHSLCLLVSSSLPTTPFLSACMFLPTWRLFYFCLPATAFVLPTFHRQWFLAYLTSCLPLPACFCLPTPLCLPACLPAFRFLPLPPCLCMHPCLPLNLPTTASSCLHAVWLTCLPASDSAYLYPHWRLRLPAIFGICLPVAA
jgi:hypothetical protein